MFAWTERANKAFQKIKKQLFSPPVIFFPDFSQLFTLTTDTSDVACGAILMQKADNRKKTIIAVASRTFNPTEQNWSTTEWEAYAIKWAILKFNYFLHNRPFVIFTNHRLLTYLDQHEFNNAKIRQWQEEISCYKFILEFVEGKSNVWADMHSRGCKHKVKTGNDATPAGKTYKFEGFHLHIYVPSWCISEVNSLRLIPRTHTPQNSRYHKQITNTFFACHSTSTIPTKRFCNHLGIVAEQMKDDAFSKIIRALESSNSLYEINVDPNDHRAFFSGTRHLCPNDKGQ